MEYIQVADQQGAYLIHYENIIRVQGLNNYSKIFFANNTSMVICKVLRWFEESLPADGFTRVHRSHLLNNQHICKIGDGSNNMLVLSNGELIRISRRKKVAY